LGRSDVRVRLDDWEPQLSDALGAAPQYIKDARDILFDLTNRNITRSYVIKVDHSKHDTRFRIAGRIREGWSCDGFSRTFPLYDPVIRSYGSVPKGIVKEIQAGLRSKQKKAIKKKS
jgi:hypothetical protein